MNKKTNGTKTLLMSVLMSAPGPLVVGLGLLSGRSSTQIADFVRRSSELLAIIASFVVYQLTSKKGAEHKKAKLERLSNIFVGAMMCLGGSFMIALSLMPKADNKGNVIPGLTIAVLGVVANTLFWRKYTKLNRAQPNAILAVQARLYRAKSLVDCCVTAALLSVALFPNSAVSAQLDLIGSFIVAVYLVWCGIQTIWEATRKYAISSELFPWNLFAPPISEKFLALAASHMKPPGFLWRDKQTEVSEHNIPTCDGENISCFVLSPKGLADNAPCLVYCHGGGFVLEAAGYHYRNALQYAQKAGCRIVFPQYRLAPAHPHPVFFEDCYSTFCWVCQNAHSLGIDAQKIGVGGDSAGATLAAAACQMALERSHPVKPKFQMLIYPFLDARNNSESCRRFTDTPMWNSRLSDRIGPMTKADRDSENYTWYSPAEAKSFQDLPPAYIETAEFDCLHDDGILYGKLLEEAGVEVVLNETKGTMHGFDIAQKASVTRDALAKRISFINGAFEKADDDIC